MADAEVAMHAIHGLLRAPIAGAEAVDQLAMTMQAVLLQDAGVLLVDLDGFVKILKGEALGVEIAVLRFGQILGEERLRQVAIDASGYMMMAGLQPRIELGLHNMAIRAGEGVGAKIGKPFRIPEGIHAHPRHGAQQGNQQENHASKVQANSASLV